MGGMDQWKRYLNTLRNDPLPCRELSHYIKFGQTVSKCIRASSVTITLLDWTVMHFEVAVFGRKVPCLLGALCAS